MAKSKGWMIGCGVALVLFVGLVVAVVLGIGLVVDVAGNTVVEPSVYQAVSVGDQESAVRDRLPSGESFVKDALKEGGPAEPAGSACSWYISGAEPVDGNETVFRFCFKDGKLAEKVQYAMK
ncbi:hypothetical protein [Streptomyces bambusae]|uniref:DUF4333 domain-containing protein n=1 Tax=Streptomyces bambusae TaxID=1550616 RepID=A0ABS6ZG49_9ACTN|nr:hypothetical protein [Streptomyces bambusae]MBW5486732.1 hypothetical protein [Streptomyces bambusae]